MTQKDELLPKIKKCPFCGATPHQGASKVRFGINSGEPYRDFVIKCPHKCATIIRSNKKQAVGAWNTRTPDLSFLDSPQVLEKLARAVEDSLKYKVTIRKDFHTQGATAEISDFNFDLVAQACINAIKKMGKV